MKIIKEGTISKESNKTCFLNWVIDCEGGKIDLDELINFSKLEIKK